MGRIDLALLLLDFNRWGFDKRQLAASTRDIYTYHLQKADRWMRDHRNKRLWRASLNDLEDYLRTTTKVGSTRNNRISAIKCFFTFLFAEGHRHTDVAQDLVRPKLNRPIYKALTAKQASAIATAARAKGPFVKALIYVMLFGGLRRDEVRLLKWSQVGQDGWIDVAGKGAKPRRIPLHPKAARALQACPKRDVEWVFESSRRPGEPLSKSRIADIVKEVGDLAGVDGLHPHVLRHTFATGLLESGSDLRTTQEAMGHADPKTTAGYLLVRNPRVEHAVGRLPF